MARCKTTAGRYQCVHEEGHRSPCEAHADEYDCNAALGEPYRENVREWKRAVDDAAEKERR